MMDMQNLEICQVFDNFQPQTKLVLLTVRQLIFEIAGSSDKIGEIEECLKWGECSYVSHSPKSGTTLRFPSFYPQSQNMVYS